MLTHTKNINQKETNSDGKGITFKCGDLLSYMEVVPSTTKGFSRTFSPLWRSSLQQEEASLGFSLMSGNPKENQKDLDSLKNCRAKNNPQANETCSLIEWSFLLTINYSTLNKMRPFFGSKDCTSCINISIKFILDIYDEIFCYIYVNV